MARKKRMTVVPVLVALAVILLLGILYQEEPEKQITAEPVFSESGSGAEFLPEDSDKKLTAFANQNDLSLDAWPEELRELLRKNPETENFVLNYPFLKDAEQTIDLSEYADCTQVPHLFQWDTRWGYTQYGDKVMGLTGCGPTSLSMVCIYLLRDTGLTPKYVAQFSEENGYYTKGFGSNWTLISEGGEKLGLDVTVLPLSWEVVKSHLEKGNPVICVFGPGDFTDSGHFAVMVEAVDGMVRILDPNSQENTDQLWDFDQIADQIQNLWACRLPEA